MAFSLKTWYDAPNPLTPISAAALNDLESRINAAVGGIGTVDASPAVTIYNSADQTIGPGGFGAVPNFDSELFDVDNQHYTSSANLTGTVAKTNGSNTLTGTGTLFTTQLSIGQLIDVPGTATERRVVTNITSDTSLTVNGNYANTASGQTAARVNTGIVFRTAGVYAVSAGVRWASNATGRRLLTINKNSGAAAAVPVASDSRPADPSAVTDQTASRSAYKFAQWDFIQALVLQTSGGNLALSAVSDVGPWMSAVRVSAG